MCVCVCARALRMVCTGTTLRFINTLILIIIVVIFYLIKSQTSKIRIFMFLPLEQRRIAPLTPCVRHKRISAAVRGVRELSFHYTNGLACLMAACTYLTVKKFRAYRSDRLWA